MSWTNYSDSSDAFLSYSVVHHVCACPVLELNLRRSPSIPVDVASKPAALPTAMGHIGGTITTAGLGTAPTRAKSECGAYSSCLLPVYGYL